MIWRATDNQFSVEPRGAVGQQSKRLSVDFGGFLHSNSQQTV
jgi:hypothetical protein